MGGASRRRPRQFGELEAEVMNVVADRGEATVHEVRAALAGSPAYTTVMTVMARLAEKGLLSRHKEGRAYVYSVAAEQQRIAGSLLRQLVERLYGGSAGDAIAHLLEAEEAVGEAELDRLEELIARKREEIGER